MEEQDKILYTTKVCPFCINKNICNKDKFKRYLEGKKVTYLCPEYTYELYHSQISNFVNE